MNQVSVKAERRAASANAVAYAEYICAPHDIPIVHAPSPVPVRETTVRQNLVADLAAHSNAGSFFIEVRPHVTDTLSVTSTSIDSPDTGNFSGTLSFRGVGTAVGPSSGTFTHVSTGQQVNVTTLVNGSFSRTGIPLICTGLATYQLQISGTFVEASQITVDYGMQTAAGFTTFGSIQILGDVSATATSTPPPFLLTSGTIGIWFRCTQTTFPYPLPVELTLNLIHDAAGGAGLASFSRQTQAVDTFGLPLASAINGLQSWRVTAQDVLVTFEGDTLNDGGSIAAARVPSRWTSVTAGGNAYADIISLPYDNYDGALKHGCHVHWIPGAISDLEPVNDLFADADYGYFKMVIAGTITHPGASIRVRVCTSIAYFSTDPSYGNMCWAPPPTDLGLLLQYVASVVPAATENDTHLIRKIAAFAGKNVNQGFKYLLSNPELIAKLSAAVLGML